MKGSLLRRLTNVKVVYVYSLIREMGCTREEDLNKCRLDSETMKHVVPFLSKFPGLESAFLGGMCTCVDKEHAGWRIPRNIRIDLTYSVNDSYEDETSSHVTRFARFLKTLCKAYRSGKLRSSVSLRGVVPNQRCKYTGKCCAWKDIRLRSGFEACQLCNMICQHFPPLDVLFFEDGQVPCISVENRMNIAIGRDPEEILPKLTNMLLNALCNAQGNPVYYPPEFKVPGFATHYDKETYARMKFLVSRGANARDARLRKELVEKPPDDDEDLPLGWDTTGTYEKRVMTVATFGNLVKLGFDIRESDFSLIDTSDIRTIPSCNREARLMNGGESGQESSGFDSD